jgi:hypothetical protein
LFAAASVAADPIHRMLPAHCGRNALASLVIINAEHFWDADFAGIEDENH